MALHHVRFLLLLCLGLLLTGCGASVTPAAGQAAAASTGAPTAEPAATAAATLAPPPAATPSRTPTATSSHTPTPTVAPSATSSPTATSTSYPTPDLSPRPLVWFGPLPPLPTGPGRPFVGAEDFAALFAENAPWTEAAGRIQVFKLYGEWVAWNATDAELRRVVSDLNRRGMAIAFEAGPLTPTEACGSGIEGFAGIEEGLRIARRIQSAGGTARFVAFDHPYDAGVLDQSANACHWSPEEVARNVARYVRAIRGVFPEIVVGDVETAAHDAGQIGQWVEAYQAATGEDLAFLHLDLDYSRADWPHTTLEIEAFLRARGIEFGIIYFGNWNDGSDEAWLSNAGERVKAYELAASGQPDHVIFQSWHDHPDRTLPEAEPYTFTWFVNAYVEDRPGLGFRREGPGANLAFAKQVTASRAGPGLAAERAVDGSIETWWGAGDFAPQWIEVDLGQAYVVAGIRLAVSQSPAGRTAHRVLVSGPGTGGEYRLLHTFAGATADLDVLSVPFAEALAGVRFVRVETTASPSWVSWREIEVIAGE